MLFYFQFSWIFEGGGAGGQYALCRQFVGIYHKLIRETLYTLLFADF
jgi:hypothetical protein